MEINKANSVLSATNGNIDLAEASKADSSKKKKSSKTNEVNKRGSDYSVSISQDVREQQAAHQKAFDIAKNTSPVRESKVADIKARIQNGTYEIDSGKIADGMLREAVKEHLAITERS